MLSPKTCNELRGYGINKSGNYYIDADGPNNGLPPKSVFCNFERTIPMRSKQIKLNNTGFALSVLRKVIGWSLAKISYSILRAWRHKKLKTGWMLYVPHSRHKTTCFEDRSHIFPFEYLHRYQSLTI